VGQVDPVIVNLSSGAPGVEARFATRDSSQSGSHVRSERMGQRTGGGSPDAPGRVLAFGRALAIPGVLAVTAGFVDGVGYLRLFGAFPANQSGNLVLLGMAFASPLPPPAWVSATSIVGFTVGVAFAAWLAGRLRPRHRPRVLLTLELVLLVGLAVATAVVGDGESPFTGAARGALLFVAAVAMGIQTEVIRRAFGVTIATTYQTGSLARVGETVGAMPRGSERQGATTTLVVLGAVVACYVAGAAVGAGPLGEGRGGLVVPCLAVGIVLLAGCVGQEPDARPE